MEASLMEDGITVRPLSTPDEMRRVEELQAVVWPGSDMEIVPAHLLLTVAQNGGVLLGAFDGEHLVGFVFGFPGLDSSSPVRVATMQLKHCSHMLGVLPHYRDRKIGLRLKQAQRQAMLERGIHLATWTYDPLASRNAYLNIRRLGAICRTYKRDHYGEMRDGLNVGLPTDRFEVEWWVASPRVVSRLAGERRPLELTHFLDAGARKLNPATLGSDGLPRPAQKPLPLEGNLALVEIPLDFGALRERDLPLALDWRLHTRQIFEGAFANGYIVTDFLFLQGEPASCSMYLLAQGEGKLD